MGEQTRWGGSPERRCGRSGLTGNRAQPRCDTCWSIRLLLGVNHNRAATDCLAEGVIVDDPTSDFRYHDPECVRASVAGPDRELVDASTVDRALATELGVLAILVHH